MNFISTRTKDCKKVSSAFAIKTGLANDGGLFMPESIPELNKNELNALIKMNYCDRAATVLSKFLTDYTYEELLDDAKGAYSKEKFGPHPAPLNNLSGDLYMLELWHGPTCAFKDMALQIMPRLFSRALRKCNETRTALILVATSGDTGKAALEGYRDIPGTKIKVFYPIDGVSRVQKMQMQTQLGSNVSVDGIVGNFDDAQSGVKKIFSDASIASKLNKNGVFLSSANSINWGRLVPQIVYYVSAYCDLVNAGKISLGEKINFCVPTGNFGNIFAAYIAKLMGLPIDKLICASNINNVLTEFLKTGVYDRNRAFHTTISPSMDILISSNLERLLFTCFGADRTRECMVKLSKDGRYELTTDELKFINDTFIGYYTDESDTKLTIKDIYENENRLIDTHTAVAVCAAKRFMNDSKAGRITVAVSTASPYKFSSDVFTSLSGHAPSGDLEALDELNALTKTDIPTPLDKISERKILHKRVIDKDDMERAVLDFALD